MGRIPCGRVAASVLLAGLWACADDPTRPGGREDGPASFTTAASPAGNVVTFFGPETFVRRKGTPVRETRTIDVGRFQAPYTLHVRNGSEGGKKRISNAAIELDATLLLGEDDFSQRVAGHTLAVDLGATAVLEVTLESAPGAELTIWIEGVDPTNMTYATVWQAPGGGTVERSTRAVAGEPTGLDLDDSTGDEVVATVAYSTDGGTLNLMRAPGASGPLPLSVTATPDAGVGDGRVFTFHSDRLPGSVQLHADDLAGSLAFTLDTDGSAVEYQVTGTAGNVSAALEDGAPLLRGGSDVRVAFLGAPASARLTLPGAGALATLTTAGAVGQLLASVSSDGTPLPAAGYGPGAPVLNDLFAWEDTPARFGAALRMSGVQALSLAVEPLAISLAQDPATTRPVNIQASMDAGGAPRTAAGLINRPGAQTSITMDLQAGAPLRASFDNSVNLASFNWSTTGVGGLTSTAWSFDNVSRRLAMCLDQGPACRRPNPHNVSRSSTTNSTSVDLDDFGTHGSGTGASFRTTLNATATLAPGSVLEITNLRFRNVGFDFANANRNFSCLGQPLPRASMFVDSRSHPFVVNAITFPQQLVPFRLGTDTSPARAKNRLARLNGASTFFGICVDFDTSTRGGLTAGGPGVLVTPVGAQHVDLFGVPSFGQVLPLHGGGVPAPHPW